MQLVLRYFFVLFLVLLLLIWLQLYTRNDGKCIVEHARTLVDSECKAYREGVINDPLCRDLCQSGEVRLLRCYSNSESKTLVVDAVWPDATSVVIKSKKLPVEQNLSYILDDSSMTYEDIQRRFYSHIKDHIFSRLHNREQIDKMPLNELLKRVWNVGVSWVSDISSMRSLWSILQQDEYFMLRYLQLRHFPRCYGFCGSTYVTDRADRSLEDLLFEPYTLTWDRRVKIAVSILDLIFELQNNSLIHCDVHPQNFGIIDDIYVIAIDTDAIYSEKWLGRAFLNMQRPCASDEDCNFVQCKAKCNIMTKTCSSKFIVANNLQFVCQGIFSDEASYFGRLGLLHSPQGENSEELKSLLKECSQTDQLPWTPEKTQLMFDKLIKILYPIAVNSREVMD